MLVLATISVAACSSPSQSQPSAATAPAAAGTSAPGAAPTTAPTVAATSAPTTAPTAAATSAPAAAPTTAPATAATSAPAAIPTTAPTVAATTAPAAAAKTAPTAPAKTAPAAAPTKPSTASTSSPPKVWNVGDTVQLQGQTLQVLSADKNATRLNVKVLISNTGTKEINVSSIASFDARSTSGETMDYSFEVGGDPVDGKILPGDNLRGDLAYSVPIDAKGLKLYYSPTAFGGDVAIVALDSTASENPFPKPDFVADAQTFKPNTTYEEGIAVNDGGLIVQMHDAELKGTTVRAAFVIYNGSQKNVTVSSLAQLSAKDASGIKGDLSFPGSTEDAPVDGVLVPSDTLSGTASWKWDAPPDGVKVYFTTALVSGHTIPWAVK